MKKSILASAAVAALGMVGAANAAILPTVNATVTDLGIVKGTGVATFPAYEAYQITLVAPSGVINGFDFTSNVTGGGISGPLVQRLSSSNGDGGYDTAVVFNAAKNATASTTGNLDSHFLFTSALDPNIVGAISAGETYGGTATPVDGATSSAGLPVNTDSNGYLVSGTTGTMTDASGIAAGIQASTLAAIYLVVPQGIANAASGIGAISTSTGTFPVTFSTVVPEPASLSLLGLGGLSLLARRRQA